jgi:putative ABC transport system permease protein
LINKLVFENLKFRPVRTTLSVLAIGVEVMLMLTIVGISEGLLADSQQRARGVGADILIRPDGSSAISLSSAPIKEGEARWVGAQPHVTIAVGSIVVPVSGLTTMTGIDFNEFDKLSGGFKYLEGGPPRQSGDVVVDRYYAQEQNLNVGSRVTLLNVKWRVCGIIEEGKLARIVAPIRVVQDATANTGKISQIWVRVDDPKNIRPVIAALKRVWPARPIYSMPEFLSLISPSNVPGLTAFIRVIIGLSVVVGFLVVFLSMYTAVLERTREVGILKALGASPGFVVTMLLRETVLLAIFGCLIGIALSFGSRYLIMTFVPGSLSQHIVPGWWPVAGAVAIAGALLGATYPGWRAARQDPIEALSYE